MGSFWNLHANDVVTLILTVVMIWAVIKAPKWAVESQWRLQLREEERKRRLAIFKMLMATRARVVDFRHVEALNMIEVEFSSSSPEDEGIRNAWKEYLDALNDPVDFESLLKVDRRRDLLAGLLYRMGKSLGYEFDYEFLKRRAYYPQGHGDEALDNFKIRKAWLEIVEGKKALKMEVSVPNPPRTGIASD